MKKKILIISQLRFNLTKEKNNLLYLNEGCVLYKRNHFRRYKTYKNRFILRYDINNKNLYKNFNYLLGIYEIFLKELSAELNNLHKIKYPIKSWRILIGPWLFEFLSIIFYNLEKLEHINKTYNLKYAEVAKIKNFTAICKNSNEFSYLTTTDEFNNSIYSDLLPYFKKIKVNYFKPKKRKIFKQKKNSIIFNSLYKLNNYLSLLLNKFYNKKIIFHDTYFSKYYNFILQIKLRDFPLFYKSPEITPIKYLHDIRFKILNYKKKNFRDVAKSLIYKYIPSSYLENFDNYISNVKDISWPKNPKLIFSSNSFFYDDFFKFWLFVNEQKNLNLITGQHGGFFSILFDFIEIHQKKISNLVVTWGYDKNKIYKSLFNFKCSNKKIKSNLAGNLLMVNYEISRFPSNYSPYNKFSYFKYFEDQVSFIRSLDLKIQKKVYFRFYPHDRGWDTHDRLKDLNLNIQYDNKKNIYNSLSNAKICYINLNSTVFLETLNLNFPTIIYFNNKNDPIREEAKKYFMILKKAGVFYEDEKSAAIKINQIWPNIDNWWNSKKVQEAVNFFCDKYSRRTETPINDLHKAFKYY
jgi:putative transferase (TIGR04331 family)